MPEIGRVRLRRRNPFKMNNPHKMIHEQGPVLREETGKIKQTRIGIERGALVLKQREHESKVTTPAPVKQVISERKSGGVGVDLSSRLVGVHGRKEKSEQREY
jgi:hypothetical protein